MAWDIIGHRPQLAALQHDITSDRLHHAYLLAGPEQIGKFTLAKSFAKALLCHQNLCHTCSDCQHIEQESHPDTLIYRDRVEEKVSGEDGRKTETRNFLISEAREITRQIHLSFMSRYRIVIIENIERMVPAAANALLKEIEEPPVGVIFILTTNQVAKILPTILSRVKTIELNTIPPAELADYLQQKYPKETAEKLDDILRLSLGKAGLAIQMVRSAELFSYRLNLYHRCADCLRESPLDEKFAYVEEITKIDKDSKNHTAVKDFLEMLTFYCQTGLAYLAAGRQEYPWSRYSLPRLLTLIDLIREAWIMVEKNVNTKLVLEHLLLQF